MAPVLLKRWRNVLGDESRDSGRIKHEVMDANADSSLSEEPLILNTRGLIGRDSSTNLLRPRRL